MSHLDSFAEYATLHTDGRGMWSREKKAIKIKSIKLNYIDNDDFKFGELIVFFSAKSWNIEKHGLIYTDKNFLKELRSFLKTQDLSSDKIVYSEQGMQGDNYVSLDVGEEFIDSWCKYFNIDKNAKNSELVEKLLKAEHNVRNMKK